MKQGVRSVAVVCGAVAISLVLTAMIGYATARSEDTRVMMTGGADIRSGANVPPDRVDAFWNSLERGRFRMSWVYCPAVASIRKDLRGTLGDAEGPENGPTP